MGLGLGETPSRSEGRGRLSRDSPSTSALRGLRSRERAGNLALE